MSHKKDIILSWWLSLPMLLLLVTIGFVPLVWPIMSKYEGIWFPVTKNVHVDLIRPIDEGLIVDVDFDKVRACEFIGISWYDTFGDRLPIIFSFNEESNIPRTRPVMDNQSAGPWKLIGIDNLDGSVAIVSHRCHPLWITYTRFYP